VSDTPRGDDPDDPDEPTIRRPRLFGSGARDDDDPATGPAVGRPAPTGPAPTSSAPVNPTPASPTPASPAPGNPAPASPAAISPAGAQTGPQPGATGSPATKATAKTKQQRKWWPTIIGIAVAAVIAVCASTIVVVAWIHDARSDAVEARESRLLRDADCLELETRLNRLTPPGATTTQAARATAIQDENAAVRIYLTRSRNQRDADAWRQLVDARTAYAESLQQQAKTRTPAFYVAPRTNDGQAVADQLARWSPTPCAGSIRRLAVPDL